ncbi:SDR family NAD(P)-dependent oxidoreductase [Pyrodictium abyssi]|uniref:SDR family NAD(P)-dependent oxidoreductase n=1 Tax=Pyrodictium abyssi TaxID=54256 RepID=UPI003B987B76
MLVTGGSGFIGSHTVERLVEQGYTVIVVDNYYAGSPERLSSIPRERLVLVEADVSDWRGFWERVSRIARPGDIAGIVHLAALVSIVEVMEKPWLGIDVNVKGTLNVLELARRLDVERVVFASSVAVYGEPKYLPIDEEHPLEPANLYGETKLMGERLLWRYQRDYGLKPIALRYFNVYGPGMRGGPYAGVVHKFITTLLEGGTPAIYGDGEQTRDFVYVGDVAEANWKALETGYVGAVNIGTGTETSINQLYKLICGLVGRCPEPRRLPPRPGDVRRSRAAIDRAREALGWQPRISLEKGLRRTLEYYMAKRKPD